MQCRVSRAINGVNASMMVIITGKTPHQDTSSKWGTLDVIHARTAVMGYYVWVQSPQRRFKRTIFDMHMLKQIREADMTNNTIQFVVQL